MLKNKPGLLISDEETRLLDRINSDNSTKETIVTSPRFQSWVR